MPFDPSSLLDISHLVTFLGGAAVGGTGKYLADRFTDQRRRQEGAQSVQRRFKELNAIMPELLNEMANDLRGDTTGSIREFVLCPNRRTMFNSSKPRFTYFETEHPSLQNNIDLLNAEGWLDDVTVGNAPIFRMTEQFVILLKNH